MFIGTTDILFGIVPLATRSISIRKIVLDKKIVLFHAANCRELMNFEGWHDEIIA